MVEMEKSVKDKAMWAIRQGKKIGNSGVIQAGENILIALANKISAQEIMKQNDYAICLRVWYR